MLALLSARCRSSAFRAPCICTENVRTSTFRPRTLWKRALVTAAASCAATGNTPPRLTSPSTPMLNVSKPPQNGSKSIGKSATATKAAAAQSAGAALAAHWELVIGAEVHAQITSTSSKLFSGSATRFAAAPNSQVAWVDAGMPGALPNLNQACVDQALRIGLALNGCINRTSMFERKHYSYCDLPLGYQITQQTSPIVRDASIDIDDVAEAGGEPRVVCIERIQLEIDSGKNLHDVHPSLTFVDLNRSGMPLLEIVSRPDMRSADDVIAFVKKLSSMLRHLGVCTADMSKSQMRVDLNISIRPRREHPHFNEIEPRIEGTRDADGRGLGARVEVKNLNSLRAMTAAIEFEFSRQIAAVSTGRRIERETRAFDVSRGETIKLRSKEDLLDYRFCPDPDLPVLLVSVEQLESVRNTIPELPDQIAKRWRQEYGLSKKETGTIVSEPETVKFFEDMIFTPLVLSASPCVVASSSRASASSPCRDPQKSANWMVTELFGRLNTKEVAFSNSPVSPVQLASIVDLIESDRISGAIGKKVLDLMMAGDTRLAEAIVVEKEWELVTDPVLIDAAIHATIAEYPKQVDEFRRNPSSVRVFDFLVGVALKMLKFKVAPKKVAAAMRSQVATDDKAAS